MIEKVLGKLKLSPEPFHLVIIGVLGMAYFVTAWPAAAQAPYADVAPKNETYSFANAVKPPLQRSVPDRIRIPKIGVDNNVITVGTDKDGSLLVPKAPDQAGWYERSPTPGEIGPAIVTGHVDTFRGPAVFWKIGELASGDEIIITRQDGSLVTFKVQKIEKYDQSSFPTEKVYGNTDQQELRLITCGGTYNPLTARYSHNVVVYSTIKK